MIKSAAGNAISSRMPSYDNRTAPLASGYPNSCSMPCRRIRKPKIIRATLCRYGAQLAGNEAVAEEDRRMSSFRVTVSMLPLNLCELLGEDLLVFERLGGRGNHLHEVRVGRHQSERELV